MSSMIQTVEYTLDLAKKLGATECEVLFTESLGQSISVRKGDVETLEFNREKGLGVTVYIGHKKGFVGTADTRPEVIDSIVHKAIDIASCMQEDPCNGLPSLDLLATEFRELDLYHPWEISSEEAIQLGIELERKACGSDQRIKQGDGAHVSMHSSTQVYANSIEFIHSRQFSRNSLSCVLIAEDAQGGMQRDYWYDTKRDARDLMSIELIAKKAAERTIHRLNGRSISTQSVPVLYDAGIASGLISHFLTAISGGSLYRKASFLCDSLGEQVFSPIVTLYEDPFVLKGLGSCNYDAEGVRVAPRNLVNQGVLEGYLLSSYSARRLGLQTTGNSGGVHNLFVQPGDQDLFDLFKTMGTGLYVTELMGHGVNITTGDYSRGASGYWIENGEIQYPVEGITIAGNLREMFKNIVAVGKDLDNRGTIITGSILIDKMMLAGT